MDEGTQTLPSISFSFLFSFLFFQPVTLLPLSISFLWVCCPDSIVDNFPVELFEEKSLMRFTLMDDKIMDTNTPLYDYSKKMEIEWNGI